MNPEKDGDNQKYHKFPSLKNQNKSFINELMRMLIYGNQRLTSKTRKG